MYQSSGPSATAFPCRFGVVARLAKTLPAFNVIPASSILAPIGAMHDRAHMVRVGLPLVAAHCAARSALPRVAGQHREPPRGMSLVGVSTLVRIRSMLHTRGA